MLGDIYDEKAILHDKSTGAVVFTERINAVPADELRDSCPYDIPRAFLDGKGGAKCDMCFDRISNNMKPSCVLTCPTECMNFGDYSEMLKLANERLAEVKKEYPAAYLGDPAGVNVIYLYAVEHTLYY